MTVIYVYSSLLEEKAHKLILCAGTLKHQPGRKLCLKHLCILINLISEEVTGLWKKALMPEIDPHPSTTAVESLT